MKPPPLEPTLWYQTAPPAPPTPPLEDDVSADVAIIGAGYCGLSAALHLAQAGRSVVVVEAEQPGFGGSGRNNGHCVPDWAWQEPDDIAARFGAERGERVNDMQAHAGELVFSLIRDHQISCEAVQSGIINVVREQNSSPSTRPRPSSGYGAARTSVGSRAPKFATISVPTPSNRRWSSTTAAT